MRHMILAYGLVCYVVFLGAFLYAIGFVGNVYVPNGIDSPIIESSWWRALAQDAALLLLFALPHSVMARPSFKVWWTKFVPQLIERSTYVLKSSVLLFVLYWFWIPIPAVAWELGAPSLRTAVWAFFWFGWLLALLSTFLINHFDLFGLRQVYLFWRRQPYEPVRFRLPLLYRWVRHPLILGFLIAFWAAPTMTAGRLLFAVATSGYCLIALRLEERDLLRVHGAAYAGYQKQVRMLLPLPPRTRGGL